ncbi:MAG: TolC family protein [Aquincola sp.]|nr:TolC family protein [Aquincola sp.]MDH4289736.1 TolC family protein [Aquincola sp.]MDH5330295.1 TolC family protein [Aquincola sp.]
MSRIALVLATAALLAACTTTPAPSPRSVAAPGAFTHATATADEPVAEFWRRFGDAELDALMAQALAANLDLRIAAARVAEARALVQGTEGLGRPNLDATANANRIRERDSNGDPSSRNAFGVGLATKWEIDLFGRIGNEQRAASATLAASEAQQRAVQVSVAAEVARNYFELRGLQEQLRVVRLDLGTQREALKLVQARLDAGRTTALDTERAKALVEGTAASVPALETALARTRMRLAVLTGASPTALDARLAEQKPLPGLPATALDAIGTPETLLARRPDVAAAEAQLRAAEARSGSARAALYPSLTLSGTLGLNAGRIGDLGDSASFAYNLGASLLWSLIDNGQRRSQVTAADARRDAALAQFDQAVLAALEETEGALLAFTRSQQRTEHLFAAAQAAEAAATIARARFDAGTIDFLTLLDAERELLQARDRLAQAQTAAATSLVAVYRSLAGGWR